MLKALGKSIARRVCEGERHSEADAAGRQGKPAFYRRRSFFFVLKIFVAVGLLVWLVASGKLDVRLLLSVRNYFPEFLIAFGLLCMAWLIQVCRWRGLVNAHGIRLPFSEACRMTLASLFCSQFLPGVAGGEIVRGYYIAVRNPKQRLLAASTVFIDRGLGLYAALVLGIGSAAIFLAAAPENVSREIFFFGMLMILMLAGIHGAWQIVYSRFAFRWFRKLISGKRIQKYTDAALSHKYTPKDMRLGIGLSVAANLFSILAFAVIGRAISPDAEWVNFFVVCPLVFISLVFPLSPGGIGVGETTAEFLFSSIGISHGATIMLLYRLMNMVLRLPGLFFLLPYRGKE